jgi:hypothetical protein
MTKRYNMSLKQRGGSLPSDNSSSLIAFLVFVIVCLVGIGAYAYYTYIRTADTPATTVKEVVVERRIEERPPAGTILGLQPDPRFGPLSPEKSYYVTPDVRGQPLPPGGGAIPINIQTQGLPDSFQQIGVLTAPGGTETSASPTRTVLPLFGRRTVYSRDKWNYYTRTDGINPVQVPVQFKRRNCDEDTGCDEILNGDSVGCPVLGQSYVANVYRNSTPRYLPAFF